MRWFYKLFTMCSLLLTKDKPHDRNSVNVKNFDKKKVIHIDAKNFT